MQVELIIAWPGRHEQRVLELAEGATVEDALQAAGWAGREGVSAYSIYGVKTALGQVLQAGDRVELLRPLQLDPMAARRRRAASRKR